MAISARTASLQEQRGNSLYGSNRIRLLSPANNAIASIAKKTATNELDVMVKNYNAGTVSNADMKAFLQKMQANPGLSEADKQEVTTMTRDFDARIEKDRLENVFRSAPDNSIQQVQAAQALANYYRSRAAGMQPDTPAYTENTQNAIAYEQKLVDINDRMKTQQRQNLRYQEEIKVNAISDNTSEQSYQKAEMYKTLYDQAVADGDMQDANKYAAYYQNAVTAAEELTYREQTQGEKTELRNILGQLRNDYHDGRISENEYLQVLAELSPRIDATGDYGLINTLNRTTDIIQKNLDKGGLNRKTTASGLPAVLGKNKGAGGSGVVTDWDQKDFDYSDNLRSLKGALDKKIITPQEYLEAVGMVVLKRADDLTNQIAIVEEQARLNPSSKIMYNGRKSRAEDVLESLYKEQENLDVQAGAVTRGDPKNLALVLVAPKEFNKSGDVTATGKSFATYELVDASNLPKDQYVQDSEGVFHKILRKQIQLTPDQLAEAYNGVYTDENGQTSFVRYDSSGNPYIESSEQYVKVYKPGSSEVREVSVTPDGKVQSFDEILRGEAEQVQIEGDKKRSKIYEDHMAKVDPTRVPQEALAVEKVKPSGTPALNPFKPLGVNPLDVAKPAVTAAQNIGKELADVVRPMEPIKRDFESSENLGITSGTPVNLPKQSIPAVGLPQQIKAPQPLSIAGAKPQVTQNLQKAVNPTGKTPVKVAAPPKPVYTPPKNADYSIAGSAKALVNNFKKLFGF